LFFWHFASLTEQMYGENEKMPNLGHPDPEGLEDYFETVSMSWIFM